MGKVTKTLVQMKWIALLEEWRMESLGFVVQEFVDKECLPRDFLNCLSINLMFPNLNKDKTKTYRVTIEEVEDATRVDAGSKVK